jgi:hypothetical protein
MNYVPSVNLKVKAYESTLHMCEQLKTTKDHIVIYHVNLTPLQASSPFRQS